MMLKSLLVTPMLILAAATGWSQTVTCSSDDGKRHHCDTDTRNGIQMIRQRSGAACQQGYSWDYDGRGVWVDHGCRADFGPAPVSPVTPDGTFAGRTVTCASEDGGRHYCNAETRAGVQMIRQRSDSPCRRGYSWDFDDRGIWVDHGCRADFALETGPAPTPDAYSGGGRTITCASEDGSRHNCKIDTRAGVQMIRQRSDSPCRRGYSWDFDDRGIWVDHGCRADFALGTGTAAGGQVPCSQSAGPERAERMVNQCLQVSTATHPPCNAQNSCSLIIDEIKRGCSMVGNNRPSFCDAY